MMIGGVAVATTLRLKGVRLTVCEVDVLTPVAFEVAFGVGFLVELPLPIETLTQSAQTRTRLPLTCEEIDMDLSFPFCTPQAARRGWEMADAVVASLAAGSFVATVAADAPGTASPAAMVKTSDEKKNLFVSD